MSLLWSIVFVQIRHISMAYLVLTIISSEVSTVKEYRRPLKEARIETVSRVSTGSQQSSVLGVSGRAAREADFILGSCMLVQ